MVGVYGVVSYIVSDQAREIGIRMALGSASGPEAHRMLGRVLGPAATGAAAGLIAALGLSRFLASSVFEISLLDPLTYVVSFSLLVGAAVIAGWLPARRAAAVDPVRVLSQG